MAQNRKAPEEVLGEAIKYSLLVPRSLNDRLEKAMRGRPYMRLSQFVREIFEKFCTAEEAGVEPFPAGEGCPGAPLRLPLGEDLRVGLEVAGELTGQGMEAVVQGLIARHLPEVIAEARANKQRLAEAVREQKGKSAK